MGHPVVTDGVFVAWLLSAVSGGDAALPKLLWDLLFQWAVTLCGYSRKLSVSLALQQWSCVTS